MEIIKVMLITISIMLLIEGILIYFSPDSMRKAMVATFKNPKKSKKTGLIEIIIALLVLFISTI